MMKYMEKVSSEIFFFFYFFKYNIFYSFFHLLFLILQNCHTWPFHPAPSFGSLTEKKKYIYMRMYILVMGRFHIFLPIPIQLPMPY